MTRPLARKASLYVCYFDLDEPLVQTQVLPYLRSLVAAGFEIHLLTFERRRLSGAVKQARRAELRAQGLRWSCLRYHSRPSLPATAYDIARGSVWTLLRCWRYRIGIVHARSHVPAAMALPAARLLGARLLFDMRGLLADEYVDAGHWRAGGLKYRLTKRLERRFLRQADATVMLTDRIRQELTTSERHLQGRDIEVIPCCVDLDRFAAASAAREHERAARGWTGRLVLAYVGKLGTWYLPREMARFFAVLHRMDPRWFFAVLTPSPPEAMSAALREEGVADADRSVSSMAPAGVPAVLAACDAGISFIRASYSKRASSPTKVGEYLAAGLPVVSNTGIGDVDELLSRHRVGVLTSTFEATALQEAARALIALRADEAVRERCRSAARDELGLETVGGPRYAAVLNRLAARTPTR